MCCVQAFIHSNREFSTSTMRVPRWYRVFLPGQLYQARGSHTPHAFLHSNQPSVAHTGINCTLLISALGDVKKDVHL
jgi:hypothetical protein